MALGVSCEDQANADKRIPWLLDTPAAIRFISAEPLLGPTLDELAELKRLSDVIGGWIIWVPGARYVDDCPTFVPMAEWLVMYAEYEKK